MGITAIKNGGGPILGFCGGRVDEMDGSESNALGPTVFQEALAECPAGEQANCPDPIGTSQVELIYVNPNGPIGSFGDPIASAAQIREIMPRMGYRTDRDQIAFIGGGHAFGRVHGACPLGPGPGPEEQPDNPYPGLCEVRNDYVMWGEVNLHVAVLYLFRFQVGLL